MSMDEPTLTHDRNLTELLAFLQYANTFQDFPPQFIPPGRDNPKYVAPTRGDAPFVIVVVFLGLATIVVLFRLWARKYINAMKMGWDDYMCIAGLISTYCFAAIQIWTLKAGGVGQHIYDTKPSVLFYMFPFQITAIAIYLFCATIIKLSITIFMLRVCPPNDRLGRILILVTFAVISITFIGSIMNSFLSCRPYSAAWDLRVRLYDKWHCGEPWKELVAWNAVYAATDLWLIVLPLRFVLHLNMPRRKRAGLFLIFALGGSATVFAILKLTAIKQTYTSFDSNWYFPYIMIYTHLELTIGLMAASLPALGFLLLRLIPSKPNSRASPQKISPLRSFFSAIIKPPFLATLSLGPLRSRLRRDDSKNGLPSSALSSDEKVWNAQEEMARERIQKFMLPAGAGDEPSTHENIALRELTNENQKEKEEFSPGMKNILGFGSLSEGSKSRGPGDEGYHSGSRGSPLRPNTSSADAVRAGTADSNPGIHPTRRQQQGAEGNTVPTLNFLDSQSPGLDNDSSAAVSFMSPVASPGSTSNIQARRDMLRRPPLPARDQDSESTLNLPIQMPSSTSIPRGRPRDR